MLTDWAMQQQVFTLSWLASQAPAGQLLPSTPMTKLPPAPWNQVQLQGIIDNLDIPSFNWEVR